MPTTPPTAPGSDGVRPPFLTVAVTGDEDKKKDAGDKGGDDEFPPVENAFFISGGPTTNMTSWQHKRERREVFSVTKATPSYLDWSEDTISFGREDHPDYVPHPGRYPLVVDPIIGNT